MCTQYSMGRYLSLSDLGNSGLGKLNSGGTSNKDFLLNYT